MSLNYGVKDIIKAMVELEECGMEFYAGMAATSSDGDLKRMLEGLADQEKKHKKIYLDLLEEYTADVEITQEQREYIRELIGSNFELRKKAKQSIDNMSEALLVAKKLEEDSIRFIDSFGQISGHKNKDFLEEIRREEEGHLRFVKKLIEDCRDEAEKS